MNPTIAPQFTGLELGLAGLGGLLLTISLVLGILVGVKMFQNNNVALGVITIALMFCSGIGHLIALVFGWIKATEWNIKGLMVAYTTCFILGLVFSFGGYGMMLPKIWKSAQEQQQKIMEEMESEPDQNWEVEEAENIETGVDPDLGAEPAPAP